MFLIYNVFHIFLLKKKKTLMKQLFQTLSYLQQTGKDNN